MNKKHIKDSFYTVKILSGNINTTVIVNYSVKEQNIKYNLLGKF